MQIGLKAERAVFTNARLAFFLFGPFVRLLLLVALERARLSRYELGNRAGSRGELCALFLVAVPLLANSTSIAATSFRHDPFPGDANNAKRKDFAPPPFATLTLRPSLLRLSVLSRRCHDAVPTNCSDREWEEEQVGGQRSGGPGGKKGENGRRKTASEPSRLCQREFWLP